MLLQAVAATVLARKVVRSGASRPRKTLERWKSTSASSTAMSRGCAPPLPQAGS